MAFNLDTCRSKDELESFARQMFNVELDKRKKLDELKNEIRQLMNGGEPLETTGRAGRIGSAGRD